MPEKKTSLFIVAAEPSNRKLLLQILTENGYAARSTTDGFSALVEISHEDSRYSSSAISTCLVCLPSTCFQRSGAAFRPFVLLL